MWNCTNIPAIFLSICCHSHFREKARDRGMNNVAICWVLEPGPHCLGPLLGNVSFYLKLLKPNDIYTGCPRRNVRDFGRVFLMLNYTDITQNTYIQSWTVTEKSLKVWQLLLTYWLPNTYWNWQEYVVSVMLISVLNIKVTCEWHKAIKQTSKPVALVSENWPLTSNHYTLRAYDRSQGRSELHLAIT